MTLRETLAAAAEAAEAEAAGVTVSEQAGRLEWRAGGSVFATLAGDVAEFRLDPAVARAALGTPDTAPSPLGPDWVAFRPQDLDRMAMDRATAWFRSAARRAAAIRH